MARVTQEKNRPSWAIKEPHVPHLPLPSLFYLFSCAASWFGYDVAKSITASLLIGCLDTSRIARETNFSLIVPFSSLGIAPNRRVCWCTRLSPFFIFIWFRRLDNASTKFFNDATRSRRGESYRSLPTSEKETQRYDKRDGRVKGWIRGSLDDCWLPCQLFFLVHVIYLSHQ